MITKFKIFENLNVLPQVGDFVLIKGVSEKLKDFYRNSIGQIINIDYKNTPNRMYKVKFENPPEELKNLIGSLFDIQRFVCWTSNKEELEIMLFQNKFNL